MTGIERKKNVWSYVCKGVIRIEIFESGRGMVATRRMGNLEISGGWWNGQCDSGKGGW